MHDALVLGVGGMGSAALAHLARRGLSVIGVEQDAVPSLRGSSVGETRVIRKAYFEDARYVPLLQRAYVLWRELEERSGRALYVRTGCMTMGPADHAAIRGVRESATRHGLPYEELSATEIRARFPAMAPGAGDVGVLEADAGYLHVEACTQAHAAWAKSMGAELRTGAGVTALDLEGGVRATLAGGEEVTARTLVLAAGAWTASLPALRAAFGDVPLAVERQVQLWFPRPRGALPAFIHFTGSRTHYAIPTADDVKVCMHHGGEPASPDTLDRAVRAADEEDVRSYLRAHLPGADAAPLRARVCMYTNTPDQHFVIGRAPRHPHVVVLAGFSGHGYKLASVVGEIAADLVATGESPFDLGMFAPTRFVAH
jgi:sarcosine oxidase